MIETVERTWARLVALWVCEPLLSTLRHLALLTLLSLSLSLPSKAPALQEKPTLILISVKSLSLFAALGFEGFLWSDNIRKQLWQDAQRYWMDNPEPDSFYLGFIKTDTNNPPPDGQALNLLVNNEQNPVVQEAEAGELIPLPPALPQNLALIVPDEHGQSGIPQGLYQQILQLLSYASFNPPLNLAHAQPSGVIVGAVPDQSSLQYTFLAGQLMEQLLSADGSYIPCQECGRRIRSVFLQRRQDGDRRTIIIELESRGRLKIRHAFNCYFRHGGSNHLAMGKETLSANLHMDIDDDEILPEACSCVEEYRRRLRERRDRDDDPPPPSGGSWWGEGNCIIL